MDSNTSKVLNEHIIAAVDFFMVNDQKIKDLIDLVEFRLRHGGKFIVFGNGGSASDSAHFVAELLGRFEKERKSIGAVDLTGSNSTLTAIANDYGYENVFSRQVEGLANKHDILLGITTSGHSKNVLKAMEISKDTLNIVLTSTKIEPIENQVELYTNFIFKVPSHNTARIQEVHIMFLHILAGLIEERFT